MVVSKGRVRLFNVYSNSFNQLFTFASNKQLYRTVMSFVVLFYRSAIRNWLFQVSKDGENWTTIKTHVDDSSLNEPG